MTQVDLRVSIANYAIFFSYSTYWARQLALICFWPSAVLFSFGFGLGVL